jgi:peptide deformylase
MSVNAADLRIITYPAAILRQRAEPVPEITPEVRAVVARMIELMQQEKGIGLAAPQVGLPWRLFVTDVAEEGGVRVYVNPELTLLPGGRDRREEGCLSIPGVHVEIERPLEGVLIARNLEGEPLERAANGFVARVWQHEFDHLNGVLILDRMSPLDRLANRKTLKELEAASSKE